MADDGDSLLGLQGLHEDLVDLEQGRLRNIDRLWAELEARVNEFRQLLDKPLKKEESRKILLSGKASFEFLEIVHTPILTASVLTGTITFDEEEFTVNQEFQESATQLADVLDLDELLSARLLLDSQQDAVFLGRSNVASAVLLFHERRQFLLECLRLLLRQSIDPECDGFIREPSQEMVAIILEIKDGTLRNGSLYAQKCMDAMISIERWLQALGERHQGALALGQTMAEEQIQIIGIQQGSLGQQHESLGAITNHLIKASRTGIEDFYKLLNHLPKLDRWGNLAVHYVPMITAFASQFGSPEGGGSLRDARMLNSKILDSKDASPWILRNLQAATITWWLAEYSGWYVEQPIGSPVQNVNLHEEAQHRSDAFVQALRDGAFECALSICSQITPDEWHDPARNALIQLLLQDSLPLVQELTLTSSHFQVLLMEQFETFTDAFITNMPDTLRHFKVEEDDQRKRFRTNLQQGASSAIPEQIFHLERFLVIASFAYDHRPDAAEAFWSDVDSNLYGFLQWASKRQSTPCVSAFCEMFRSISAGEDCAASAHRFLLEEAVPQPAKIRRAHSLSWAQIFGELNVYTAKIREQPTVLRPMIQYGGRPGPDEIDEPESSIMLESYLRLTSHLCRESAEIRSWILSQSDFPILEVLLYLCNNGIPNSLQACAFMVIQALLTNKPTELSMTVWSTLDLWISGGLSPSSSVNRPPKPNPAMQNEQVTFDSISGSFETANEFMALLHNLMCPAVQDTGLNDQLPFPESLGSSYRMSGVEPYIDFVFDKVFTSKKLQVEDKLRQRILTWNVLRFAAVCLDTFNEDLVILANRSSMPVDEAMNTSSLLAYVRLHPFARVMEWMFNERVLAVLFGSAHQDIDEVAGAASDSPLSLSILCSIDVMNLITDLQSTYLDIVRPLIKMQSTGRKQPVLNPSLASFEDSVSLNLQLIVDLGMYSGIGNQDLSVSSLKLLGKLASSRKLNVQSNSNLGQRMHSDRLIGIVEQNGDMDSIASSMTLALQFDERELSHGSDAPGWTIKSVILDFLGHCLSRSPDRPTLAHALLGFTCTGTTVDIVEGGSFAEGQALFHAILHLVIDYPNGDSGSMQGWSLGLKQKGMQILSTLWSSPLTSIFTLSEMRLRDFFFLLFTRQRPVVSSTMWDGRSVMDPDFSYAESAEALEQFLWQRCTFFEYASTEIRLTAAEGAPSMKERVLSTLLGLTTTPNGDQVQNMTVFDLLDFIEVHAVDSVAQPQLGYFTGIDFGLSSAVDSPKNSGRSDMRLVHEMIMLRLSDLRLSGRLQDPNEQQRADAEAQLILLYRQSVNAYMNIASARMQTIKAWADLLTIAIGTSDLGQAEKSALILQALQLVTPKLEDYAMTNRLEAKEIARLALALLFQFDFGSAALDQSRAGDVANDRLFQVFRTALRAVNCPNVDMQLREMLYKICYHYLSRKGQTLDTSILRRQGIQTVKSTGEKTMDIMCDDAYGASGTCRISALLLLDSLASLATLNKSNFIVEALARTNFIQILVESIENVPQELREANSRGK